MMEELLFRNDSQELETFDISSLLPYHQKGSENFNYQRKFPFNCTEEKFFCRKNSWTKCD